MFESQFIGAVSLFHLLLYIHVAVNAVSLDNCTSNTGQCPPSVARAKHWVEIGLYHMFN